MIIFFTKILDALNTLESTQATADLLYTTSGPTKVAYQVVEIQTLFIYLLFIYLSDSLFSNPLLGRRFEYHVTCICVWIKYV